MRGTSNHFWIGGGYARSAGERWRRRRSPCRVLHRLCRECLLPVLNVGDSVPQGRRYKAVLVQRRVLLEREAAAGAAATPDWSLRGREAPLRSDGAFVDVMAGCLALLLC